MVGKTEQIRARRGLLDDEPAVCIYKAPFTVAAEPFYDLRDVPDEGSFRTWCGDLRIKSADNKKHVYIGIDAALTGSRYLCHNCAEAVRLAISEQTT